MQDLPYQQGPERLQSLFHTETLHIQHHSRPLTDPPQVEDPPGTYLWHDHAAGFKGDGLQGPLLVLPPRAPPAAGKQPAFGDAHVPDLWSYDAEHVVFISDWWVS